ASTARETASVVVMAPLSSPARRTASDRVVIIAADDLHPSDEKGVRLVCWDGGMTTLLEVWRREARGTPRRQIVSEAMLTFTVGVGLIAVGLVHTSGTPVVDISSRWVFILPLSVLCLLMLVKRSRPVTALGAGTVAFVGDAL